MPAERLPRVVYVAGYSRSGSTLLDMLLGSHPEIAATGELTFLADDADNPNRSCSCGATYPDCPFWGPWLAGPAGRTAVADRARHRRVQTRRALAAHAEGRLDPGEASGFAATTRSLLRYLARETGAGVVLDSSKSARDAAARPIALAQLVGAPVRIIHLTRDPRAVIGSYLKHGSNWVIEGHRQARLFESLRPILGWQRANLTALKLRTALGPEAVLHLRYEDLLADPETALHRIGAFIEVDLAPVAAIVRAKAAFTAGHNVGGNRARHTPQVLSPPRARRSRLPLAHAALLRLTGRGLARRFGYS